MFRISSKSIENHLNILVIKIKKNHLMDRKNRNKIALALLIKVLLEIIL